MIKPLLIAVFLQFSQGVDLTSLQKQSYFDQVYHELNQTQAQQATSVNATLNTTIGAFQSYYQHQFPVNDEKLDLLQNHTLEDDRIKVQIGTKPSSATFGAVLSIQMKFTDQDSAKPTVYSDNLMNPGCRMQWSSNTTIRHPKSGKERLAYHDSSSNIKAKKVDHTNEQSIQMSYDLEAPELEEHLQVNMMWSLNNGKLELQPAFDMRSPNAGLFDFNVNFGCIKIQNNTSYLDNEGFGILSSPPRNYEFVQSPTMQFVALYTPQKVQGEEKSLGLYYGLHDSQANDKYISASFKDNNGALGLAIIPPEASEGNKLHELPYAITIQPFEGDWYDASDIYRQWVIPNAEWTKKGRLADRKDVPSWSYNLTTWVTDFLPSYANLAQITEMTDRMKLDKGSLAVHAYNWDYLGNLPQNTSDDTALLLSQLKCENKTSVLGRPAHCGFDTHYPEFLPAKVGFEKVLQTYKDHDFRMVPYTNGHLFDTQTKDWTPNLAQSASVKMNERYHIADYWKGQYTKIIPAVLNITQKDFNLDFLSHEPSYAVESGTADADGVTVGMCPATEYWQKKMINLADKIVNDYNFDGIYYDQIGAVFPVPCFDRTHNHPMGGGNHWTQGNRKIFEGVQSVVQGSNAERKGIIMTEDQNEVYIGESDIFLTLFGFRRASLPGFLDDGKNVGMTPKTPTGPQEVVNGTYRTVPAYQSIYDGFVMYAGAEMPTGKYYEHVDEFAEKMASQFVMGVQLGMTNMQNDANPKYGKKKNPFRDANTTLSQVDTETEDPEMNYISILSQAKRIANDYFLHGRVMRDLPDQSHLPLRSLISIAWLSKDGSSLLIPITSPKQSGSFVLNMTLDLQKYGFNTADASKQYSVSQLQAYKGQKTQQETETFPGNSVQIQRKIQARDIILLKITEVAKHSLMELEGQLQEDWN